MKITKLTACVYAILLILSPRLIYAQIPVGDITGPFVWKSTIYPGTERNYWLYVPKQYDAGKPTCSIIVQDGLSRATGWNLTKTLDSLIALKEIPVVLGIFVDHGKVASIGDGNYPRYNRSFEYDALGDRYARFLLEEMLPEVARSYNLSKDPNDRMIAGASSGAICAFNAAWEKPDEFRRVLSTIGTYVGLRGGDEYATLVRKTEPKPLRVFLQDGTKDLNIYAGDWWMANQDMLSALTFAGYAVNHAWGDDGGHDSKHTVTILADALKWLWKDYPAPIVAHRSLSPGMNPLIDGEAWHEVQSGNQIEKIATNARGEIFLSSKQSIYRVNEQHKIVPFGKVSGATGGIGFGADGYLYAGDLIQHKIIAFDEKGVSRNIALNVNAGFIVTTDKGIYFSDENENRIGFYSFSKKKVQYFNTSYKPTGLAISAEQTFMNVSASNGVFGYSFKIETDGSLSFGQAYIHYHIPYGNPFPAIGGMTVDSDNVLYSATAMGVQVSDQLGRVNFIFSNPGTSVTDVKIGGSDFNTLNVVCDGKFFQRKVKAKGVLSWLPSVKPPKPGM